MTQETPDIERFRNEYPAFYHEGLPDEVVEKLLAYHVAVLHFRIQEVGAVLRKTTPFRQLFDWVDRRLS